MSQCTPEHHSNPITYITDCRDDNTRARLKIRVGTLFPGSQVTFIRVSSNLTSADFEAALNLVDVIDAYNGHPGIILANVAPRHAQAKRWPNGTPFGWLRVDEVDIFSTIDGYTLSLIKKLTKKKLTVRVYDIPEVVPHIGLPHTTQKRIIRTQFRSFDYLPRLAAAIVEGKELPYEEFSEVPDIPLATCWVDSFGNIKTNILPEEINFAVGKRLVVRVSDYKQLRLSCYERLKDVPDGEIAFVVGSSGLEDQRFVEIMQQGEDASKTLGLESGALIEYVPS